MERPCQPVDCICDGKVPFCAVCLVGIAVSLRVQHPDSLSVGLLKRRIPRLSGREAAILVEATKRLRLGRAAA